MVDLQKREEVYILAIESITNILGHYLIETTSYLETVARKQQLITGIVNPKYRIIDKGKLGSYILMYFYDSILTFVFHNFNFQIVSGSIQLPAHRAKEEFVELLDQKFIRFQSNRLEKKLLSWKQRSSQRKMFVYETYKKENNMYEYLFMHYDSPYAHIFNDKEINN